MEYAKIAEIVKSKGWTLGGLAEKIGVTRAGLYKTLEKRSLKVETLERIAKVLEVPIGEFFESQEKKLEFDILKLTASTQNDLLIYAMHLLFNVRTTNLRLYEGVVSLKKALEDEGQDACFNHPAATDLNRVIEMLSKDDRIYEHDDAITKLSEMLMDSTKRKKENLQSQTKQQ